MRLKMCEMDENRERLREDVELAMLPEDDE